MNKEYYKILITNIILGLILIYTPKLNAKTYGLKFQGQDVTLDKRTELDLTPNDFLKFQDEFEISFDYKIDLVNPNSLFGYVIRIISQENINVDLISTPSPDIQLNLVVGKSNSVIPVRYPENSINNWINLRIKFLLSDDRMIFYTADSFYVQDEIGFGKQDAFKIIFGANDVEQFKTTDVPSMNIRNVKIFEKGELKQHWPLDEVEGNAAMDRIKKEQAFVKNPIWLMNRHQTWQTLYKSEVEGQLMVASDLENARIFMVGSDELVIYSATTNSFTKINYLNKPLFLTASYNAIYNSTDKKIYCYLVDNDEYYSLDTETGKWNETGSVSTYETKFRHHNRYYNPANNSIYLFGGYGLHKYNNEIRRIDLTESSLQDLQTDDSIFQPRYLAGLGALNDTIYILGGYGSESGNQLINPRSYYDLFGYSINNESLFKKFDIPRIIDDMTVANSMFIDESTRDYYALIFEKSKTEGYLQLIKGSLDSPEVEMLGDKIPFQFLDIRSFASLIYMPKLNKLYVFTSYSDDSTRTKAGIYSISYPPNKSFIEPVKPKKAMDLIYMYVLTAFILLGLSFWILKKRKKKATIQIAEAKTKELTEISDLNQTNVTVEDTNYQIVLFGGFQVFDKDFVDITNRFSPLLKELYLLIMLHTFKNNKGISSKKITEILWFDKSEKSSRNNQAVNIAKLRTIINDIGTCELTKKTGYWKIIPDEHDVKSDYQDFLNLISSKTNLSKQKIYRLIKITEKGSFLHNVQYDWLDEFKATVSETIIDTLIKFANSCDIKKDAEFIIHLSDCVFNFDVVNEDAMILKCKAEHCMGKHSLAKSTYERFFKEYRIMYNQEYEKSFINILEL